VLRGGSRCGLLAFSARKPLNCAKCPLAGVQARRFKELSVAKVLLLLSLVSEYELLLLPVEAVSAAEGE
jgi:hypothetical protein